MKHLFVPYELALKLKEKGFEFDYIDILGFYSKKYGVTSFNQLDKDDGYEPAPLYQQVIDWFRERRIQIIETAIPAHINRDTMYVVKELGRFSSEMMPLNKAIEEALKLI